MIRVLVVEDSRTVQRALVAALESDPAITVVGCAETGEAAVEAAASLRPDLVTMDLHLPGMDGYEATRAIMSLSPVPVVIVTSKVDPADSSTLFRVMEAGALMVLAKPEPPGTPRHAASVEKLIRHVKLMAEIKVVRRTFPRPPAAAPPPSASPEALPDGPVRVVAIGASTGGPPLLGEILSSLPERFPLPVMVVQHMADGFTGNFVHWLNQNSRLPVALAQQGEPLLGGRVYVAPEGSHLEAGPGERVQLSTAPPVNGLRPAVCALFRSVALRFGPRAAGVLLSGMGSDGARGLLAIRDKGGITVAQDRESSVVFGMPGAAVALGAARYVLPPDGIVRLLIRLGSPHSLATQEVP
ncbi:chemotaxis response regulator protein-glutamate methylesterase [Geomonas sp. Red276]